MAAKKKTTKAPTKKKTAKRPKPIKVKVGDVRKLAADLYKEAEVKAHGLEEGGFCVKVYGVKGVGIGDEILRVTASKRADACARAAKCLQAIA